MRCYTLSTFALLALIACSDGKGDGGDSGTTPDGTTAGTATTGTATGNTGPEPWRYRATSLQLADSQDVDGDGTIDNNMFNAMGLLNTFMGLDLETFNTQLNASLYPDNIIGFEADIDGTNLALGVVYGSADGSGTITIDASSYSNGVPVDLLEGAFTAGDAFAVGPASITVPVVIDSDLPAVDVILELVEIEGTMTESGFSGSLRGALPTDQIIDGIVDPLVDEAGVDTDGDGEIDMTKEEIIALVESLAPGLGDIPLEGGSQGVSCWFAIEAESATF